jgi:hypothetical protein
VVAGLLYVACALGMRRVLHPGPGSTWGPLLVAVNGVGLIMGGVFVADPGAGFPPGAPPGPPEQFSWHGVLHNVAPVLAFNAMIVGLLVFARRFAALGQRGWVAASITAVVALVGLTWWPDLDGISVRLVLACGVLFGFVAALAVRFLRDLSASTAGERADPAGIVDGEDRPRA